MGAHGDYLEKDRTAARNFGEAARRAGVRRIVYLGGLVTGGEAFSKHLKSRIETGETATPDARGLEDGDQPSADVAGGARDEHGRSFGRRWRHHATRLPMRASSCWYAA
jgi:hypothetical protein